MLTYSSSYSRYTIPAGTYKGQDEDINTIGVKSVLITSDSISEALVKQLTQMLFKKSKELQYSTSLDLQIDDYATFNWKAVAEAINILGQTLAVAVLVLLLGNFLKKRINFLEKFCIPSPVIGGLLFAIMTCICYTTGIAEFSFDDTLREVCMVFFFTSVGFQANLKVLKSGGKSLIVFLGLVIVLILLQNVTAVGLAKALGLDPLIGMCTGSIPMVGGHGTAGAFGPVLEDFNISGATTICTAAATFGLIFGSLVGGPLGKRLIEKHIFLILFQQKMTAYL